AVAAGALISVIRRRPPETGAPTVGGRLSARLRPTPAAGVRFALEPGRGRTAVPIRSALFTGVFAITAVLAALVFSSSLADARHTPERYGVNWDLTAGGFAEPTEAAAGLKQLQRVRGVDAIAGINSNEF